MRALFNVQVHILLILGECRKKLQRSGTGMGREVSKQPEVVYGRTPEVVLRVRREKASSEKNPNERR